MRDLEIRGAGNLLGAEQSGHIAAVGFDLYVEMVTEAVGELTGEVREHPAEVQIDLPVTAHLPGDYIARDDVRMEAYRRLAAVTTPADVDDVRAEWEDRYGPPPRARAWRCSTWRGCGPRACGSASGRCRCRRAGPASTAGICSSRRRSGCSAWSRARRSCPTRSCSRHGYRRRLDRPGAAQVARHDQPSRRRGSADRAAGTGTGNLRPMMATTLSRRSRPRARRRGRGRLGLTGCSNTTTDAATVTYKDASGSHTVAHLPLDFESELHDLIANKQFAAVAEIAGRFPERQRHRARPTPVCRASGSRR